MRKAFISVFYDYVFDLEYRSSCSRGVVREKARVEKFALFCQICANVFYGIKIPKGELSWQRKK
jgi:hypothetical protein